jgi:hypothetical protein
MRIIPAQTIGLTGFAACDATRPPAIAAAAIAPVLLFVNPTQREG